MKTVIVTPSYFPDLNRCKMLVDSVKRYVDGAHEHLLLIDSSDRAAFSSMQESGVRLIDKESLLPSWLHRSRWPGNVWVSKKTLPVRGWIIQQVAKMAVAEQLDSDVLLFADSDVAFVRPFNTADLIIDSSLTHSEIRFYRDVRKPHFYRDRRYRNWYNFAKKSLALSEDTELNGAYITQLASWRRETALQLFQHLEQKNSRSWQETLLRSTDLSEYILYGVFVEHVLNCRKHAPNAELLCHSSWYYPVSDQKSLESYIGKLRKDQVAIHIQSNLGIDVDQYADSVARITSNC